MAVIMFVSCISNLLLYGFFAHADAMHSARYRSHFPSHLKRSDQHTRSLVNEVFRAGLTSADGDLERTWLDHPLPFIIN
jgi:hypothetical protein